MKYFGTEEGWYSFKPPEYAWLQALTPVEQVAGQIHFIRVATDAGISQVPPEKTLTIHYEAFCQDPSAVWQTLSQPEAERFRSHLVPTWAWHERRDLWEQAQREKDHWIIKPRAEGRGIGVKAGCMTDEVDWQATFAQADAADLTLQPFIPQNRIHGQVGEEERNDYIVGTLLFFEDHFFGPGVFRASTHQITNQGETRRLAHLVTGDLRYFDQDLVI